MNMYVMSGTFNLKFTQTKQLKATNNEVPGYSQTNGAGTRVESPLPDECTIMLVKGSFQLDDEKNKVTETCVAFRTKGSKTLITSSDSTVVWTPIVCCWDIKDCSLAKKGQCLRL